MQIRNKSDVEEDFDSETVCVCAVYMCRHVSAWCDVNDRLTDTERFFSALDFNVFLGSPSPKKMVLLLQFYFLNWV